MAPKCGKIYRDLGYRHWCMLAPEHIGACRGPRSSEDLVPENARKILVEPTRPSMCSARWDGLQRHAEKLGLVRYEAFVWPSEDVGGVWIAYAPPPYDVMTQGRLNGGSASAIESLQDCVILTLLETQRRFAS
jgi:hypothetical protein